MNRLNPVTLILKNKTIAAGILVIALLLACAPTHAGTAWNTAGPFGKAEQALVYQRAANPYIGITVSHAAGQSYSIADKNGKIILKGRISSDKTFFVPTAKLAYGSYQFLVGGAVMQQFIIQ